MFLIFLFNLIDCFLATNVKMGLVETKLAIIPGGGKETDFMNKEWFCDKCCFFIFS